MSPGRVRAIPPTVPKVSGRLPWDSVAAFDRVIDVDEGIAAIVVPVGDAGAGDRLAHRQPGRVVDAGDRRAARGRRAEAQGGQGRGVLVRRAGLVQVQLVIVGGGQGGTVFGSRTRALLPCAAAVVPP